VDKAGRASARKSQNYGGGGIVDTAGKVVRKPRLASLFLSPSTSLQIQNAANAMTSNMLQKKAKVHRLVGRFDVKCVTI